MLPLLRAMRKTLAAISLRRLGHRCLHLRSLALQCCMPCDWVASRSFSNGRQRCLSESRRAEVTITGAAAAPFLSPLASCNLQKKTQRLGPLSGPAAWFWTGSWTSTICTAVFLAAALTDWLDGYLARKLVGFLGRVIVGAYTCKQGIPCRVYWRCPRAASPRGAG